MMATTPSSVRPCPVCGSTDESNVFREANFDPRQLDAFAFASRKIPEYMHHRLVACPMCDLLYVSPMPSMPEMQAAYHEAAFDSAEEAGCASRTYAALLRRIMPMLPDRVGAATEYRNRRGVIPRRTTRRGLRSSLRSGTVGRADRCRQTRDPSPHSARVFSHGGFSGKQLQPDHLFSNNRACLRAAGYLPRSVSIAQERRRLAVFLVGHNRRALSAKIMGTKSPIFDIEHMQLFSPASGKRLLSEAGFANIQVGPTWNRYPLHYWLKLVPIPRTIKLAMIRGLKRARIGYLPVKLPAGNLMAVGYKPV